MKKQLFVLALLLTGAVFASTQVLYEDDFESYTTGDWLGQGNTELMQSTVHSSPYEAPAPGEVEIVEKDNSKVLHVNKVRTPDGVEKPGRDRGVRVPLNWGSVDYNGGVDGVIIIIGKVNIPAGNGYAELRLATSNDDPMMRFCVHSSDYKTYCYTNNRRSAPNSGAANYGDARWPSGSADKIQYSTDDAVVRDTWCNFMLTVDCHTGTLTEYYITDNGSFSFRGEKVCQLFRFQNRPAYAEFTAAGNGYDTTRNGAYFDDLRFSYVKSDTPWVTVFEDDFESYEVGESLTEQTDFYQRLGGEETFSDLIVSDATYGKCAKLWINKPSGYPKDGVKIVQPNSLPPAPLSKLRVTAKYYCPDNGTWTKFMNGNDIVCTYGFHSANQWFATWSNDDASPRYDAMESTPYNTFVETTMTITCDEEGTPALDSIAMRHDSDQNNKWGLKWSQYFDTTLSEFPNTLAFQVQGWNDFDGRYLTLSNVKVEYAAPEPAFLGLLALAGLAFLRKRS